MDSSPQAEQAALWVRYLLEGDDARHADQFFTAMSTALAQGTRDSLSSKQKARGVAVRQQEPLPENPLGWDSLTRQRIVSTDVSAWLADPQVGQPIVKPIPSQLPLSKRHEEMVLILKLARRFPPTSETSIEPRVYEYRANSSANVSAQVREPESVVAFYERLTDPRRSRWATIDASGQLLLSSDRQRLAALFSPADCTYRTSRQDGHVVLEASFASGDVFESWLEENSENPKRPIAHIRLKPTEQPSKDKEQASRHSGTTLRVVQ
jgi:hypothetical protein